MRVIRPKYQVFVSSTFTDLVEERREVMWGVLKARHIPVGMEHFGASDDRGWRVIQRTIDLSDYYVLVIAGRYGHIDGETGISWTEREYNYAYEQNIPVLVFMRSMSTISMDKSCATDEGRTKLSGLLTQLRSRHLVQEWSDGNDLREKVVDALRKHIDDDEDAGEGRPGWYRGDQIPISTNAMDEFSRLSRDNAMLREQLRSLSEVKTSELVLSVQGIDDLPLYEVDAEDPDLWVSSEMNDFLAFAGHPVGTVSRAAYQAFIDERNRWFVVGAVIENIGERTARDISVTLSMSGVSGLDVQPPTVPVGALSVSSRRIPEIKTDPAQHSYIDDYNSVYEVANIKFRIRTAAPGAKELMPVFWVKLPVVPTEIEKVTVRYQITKSEGGAQSGELEFALVRNGRSVLRYSEAENAT